METGYLSIQVTTGDEALPIANAHVKVFNINGNLQFDLYTDESGFTETVQLYAPDAKYTLDPTFNKPAYSVWDVDIESEGYETIHVHDVEVVDTQTSILPVHMLPLADEESPETEIDIYIPPIGLLIPDDEQLGVPDARVLRQVRIPEYITVHLGTPTNAAARNVRVKFTDYIKNVTSSEIYSTWPQNSIIANIHAIVTFVLNRIYTEWYRSRGFNFDITNSTAYDQYYRDGANIYQNISQLVDKYFNIYARRIGHRNPFFTSFCNGTTSTCAGLSQWGTVTLANQGMTPLQILHYYYPDDLELVATNNIGGIVESYPGYPLQNGSRGDNVRLMQNYLNRIAVNFPLIPQITPDGVFGPATETAVRTFQRTFNLATDAIIGRDTWNKISFIFVGVSRLAELDSEGIRETIGTNPPNVVLSQGSRGEHVLELQFIINAIAPFFDEIPMVITDSVFGFELKNAVIEFQKRFGLTQDGIVGPVTWNKLYSVYRGISNNVDIPHEESPVEPPVEPPASNIPQYPGTPLKLGSTGADVRLMQTYLNVIRIVYPTIPYLIVDGSFGERTHESVLAFQNLFLLAPDGIIGPDTWDYIVKQYRLVTGDKPLSLDYPGVSLRRGSAGSDVRLMQTFLSEMRSPYPSLPPIIIDGIFGVNTENAVIGFQRLFGLTPDGIIGEQTWNEIIRQRNLLV